MAAHSLGLLAEAHTTAGPRVRVMEDNDIAAMLAAYYSILAGEGFCIQRIRIPAKTSQIRVVTR